MTQIKAEHITNWNHPNCKFNPNDIVKVDYVDTDESNKLKQREGQTGEIIAASSSQGLIRGGRRQFTRYYVQFSDGYVGGFHSHFLSKVG